MKWFIGEKQQPSGKQYSRSKFLSKLINIQTKKASGVKLLPDLVTIELEMEPRCLSLNVRSFSTHSRYTYRSVHLAKYTEIMVFHKPTIDLFFK